MDGVELSDSEDRESDSSQEHMELANIDEENLNLSTLIGNSNSEDYTDDDNDMDAVEENAAEE